MFFRNKEKISVFSLILIVVFSIRSVEAHTTSTEIRKMVVIGGGHVGLIEACLAYFRAQKMIKNYKLTYMKRIK